jgi:phage-related protein (TIGR01555 family)
MSEETKPGILEKAKKFAQDGWSNLVSGLNSAKTAKKKYTHHSADVLLSDEELESIYIEDGLGKRIVNLLPSDMFREGWNYTFPDMEELKAKELSDKYAATMEILEAPQRCKEALQWARLLGGSAILIGVLDGRTMENPLDPKRIKSFEKLRVLDRTEIDFQNIQFQMDPMKPRYGLPEYYPVKFAVSNYLESEKLVHHSRIIEFHGDHLPSGMKRILSPEQRYWGLSILQQVDDHLKTLGTSIGSIDQLLQEMSIGKFKIKDLAQLLSTNEGKEAITRRVELMDLTRSVFRSQYFDSEEDYSRDTVSFTGIPEILYIIFMLIAADTGYPITRLFGVSPAGMNSTGESDMRNYYDAVRAEQTAILYPVILRLVRIISEWQGIEEPYIEFIPLQTMNEKERAELDKQKADTEQVKATTYKTYIDSGILEPYEARWLEFGETLKNIPVPEEDTLPPVETMPEGESNAGETGAENEDETEAEEGRGKKTTGGNAPDKQGDNSDDNDSAMDGPEDIKTRITELEEKEKLTAGEKKELADLKKQLRKKKGVKP